ncbi:nuclear transport factor 2 family protein [Mastigocoleus testarum]|uniref:nuclear transport factor 2 family protein n=1 Tax=Mastigocoleus testarum TaxID=996925 RepID=UPI000427E7E9|nr:nuclear transport factor 2 family protein [Mastigocoleus testarum]
MKRILTAFIFTAIATVFPTYIASGNLERDPLLAEGFEKKNFNSQRQIPTFNSVDEIVPRSSAARVVKEFLQSLEAKDTNAIALLWSQDAAVEVPYDLQGRSFPNREAAQRYIEEVIQPFSEIRFERIRLYQTRNPNVVIIEGQGDFTIAEDGRSYRNTYISVFQTKGNKLSLIREYFNPLIIARTFGVDLNPTLQESEVKFFAPPSQGLHLSQVTEVDPFKIALPGDEMCRSVFVRSWMIDSSYQRQAQVPFLKDGQQTLKKMKQDFPNLWDMYTLIIHPSYAELGQALGFQKTCSDPKLPLYWIYQAVDRYLKLDMQKAMSKSKG